MLDYEVQRCTRKCSATDVQLEPGESYYSVLVAKGAEVIRHDYSRASWQGPPEGALGWWVAKIPTDESVKPKLAPSEVALELFDRWRAQPTEADAAYVLALLLVRRRVLRFSDSPFDDQSDQRLRLFCPSRANEYSIPIVQLENERADQIQQRLIELLYDNH